MHTSACVVALTALCLTIAPAFAQSDAIPTYSLQELWRVELETNDDAWHPRQAAATHSGNTYVLDLRSNTITTIDSSGTVSQVFQPVSEGSDPFESIAVFLTPDRVLGVVHRNPTQIRYFSPNGVMLRTTELKSPTGPVPTLGIVNRADYGGGSLFLSSQRLGFGQQMELIAKFDGVEMTGPVVEREIDPGDSYYAHDILFNAIRWDVFPNGDLIASTHYTGRELAIVTSAATTRKNIPGEYESLRRTDAEVSHIADYLGQPGLSMGNVPQVRRIHRDIEKLHCLGDSLYLVLSSRGARTNTMGQFELRDRRDRMVTLVSLLGDAHPLHDSYFFCGSRLIVTRDTERPAADCFQRLDRASSGKTVICFDISPLMRFKPK